MSDGASALQPVIAVSRETIARLERYVQLMKRWQPVQNLVSPKTLDTIWSRHIADSAQLVAMFPTTRHWVDIGSGAGLPGLVTAILLADQSDAMVHCIESNQRKCAFMRTVIRETGAAATVHEGRIESVLQRWALPVERISARALASFGDLLDLTAPLRDAGAIATLHKGEDFDVESVEASKSWSFDLIRHKSMIDHQSLIVEVCRAERRA